MAKDEVKPNFTLTRDIDLRVFARGAFLEKAMRIEEYVSNCISYHFCKTDNKANEFSELVLGDRMTFGRKAEMLKSIIKNNYSKMLRDEPTFITRLDAMNEFRNKLAHGMGVGKEKDIREEGAGYFTLAIYKSGKIKTEKITVEQLIEKEKDAEYVYDTLIKLWLRIILPKKYRDYDW